MSILSNPHFNNYMPLVWPASVNVAGIANSAICKSQSILANTEMNLNGNVGGNPFGVSGRLYSRSVNLISSSNNAFNIIITGYFMGNIISEVITGPNNNTVTSANFYQQIISVVPSQPTTNLAVDFGFFGLTPLFVINEQTTPIVNASILAGGTGTLKTTLCIIQDDFGEITSQAGVLKTPNFSSALGTNTGSSYQSSFGQNGAPVLGRYATINVTTGTTADASFTGSLCQYLKVY